MSTQPSKPPAGLRLELTEPNRKDSGWEFRAIATVARGSWPEANVNVQFYLDGQAVDGPEASDGEGRVAKEFVDILAGTHTIEIKIVGSTTSSKKVVHLKEPKKPRASKLLVNKAGEKGKYTFAFQVLTEEDMPVKDAVIRVLDTKNPNGFTDLAPTDEKGTTTYKIEFTDRRRPLDFTVLGTAICKETTVFNGGE